LPLRFLLPAHFIDRPPKVPEQIVEFVVISSWSGRGGGSTRNRWCWLGLKLVQPEWVVVVDSKASIFPAVGRRRGLAPSTRIA
jgi:hypothetical protein